MLTVDPANRITVQVALEHRWFKNCIDKQHVQVPKKLIQKLRRQKASSMLSREALKIIVKHLPTDVIEDLNSYFNALDPQSTGFITVHGLEDALCRCGYSFAVEEIEDIIKKHDYMGKGRIKYSDFLLATLDRKNMLDEENLWVAFRFFDIENTGKLTLSTIQSSLIRAGCEVSEDDIQKIREEFGIGPDDFVDFDNFKRIMIIMNSSSPAVSEMSSPLEKFYNDSGPSRKISTDLRSHVITLRRTSVWDDNPSRAGTIKRTIISPPEQETCGEAADQPKPKKEAPNIVVREFIDL
mmetsp:Transcript_34179/g.59778  ORF Transcript_34179/g.59778 Transcript_34179/m.59778 type:complete len:296 (-) Transcript_34179:19-906(-)